MGILDSLFPKFCLECKKPGKYFCSDCLSKVEQIKLKCPYCYKPSIDGTTHFICSKKYGLDGLFSVWKYDGVVRKGLISLKYRYATEVGKELFDEFLVKLYGSKDSLPVFDSIVPIPLYWYRQNVRGFNQSLELSKRLSEKFGWEILEGFVVRKKYNVPQVLLKGEERRKNLKDVFETSTARSGMSPGSVVLVDDVYTTGSTLKEAARSLKKAGLNKVWGLTIAA